MVDPVQAINGVPTCANEKLTEVLRGSWKFDGYITSDSGAVRALAPPRALCSPKQPHNIVGTGRRHLRRPQV